jgi:hypothetical protein
VGEQVDAEQAAGVGDEPAFAPRRWASQMWQGVAEWRGGNSSTPLLDSAWSYWKPLELSDAAREAEAPKPQLP